MNGQQQQRIVHSGWNIADDVLHDRAAIKGASKWR